MPGLTMELTLFLLTDLVLGLSAQPFHGMLPDALFREMTGRSGGSRRGVQRQQRTRLPLYMMQLYHTLRTEDRARSPTAISSTAVEDISGLHDTDSVISLVAKSKYSCSKLEPQPIQGICKPGRLLGPLK